MEIPFLVIFCHRTCKFFLFDWSLIDQIWVYLDLHEVYLKKARPNLNIIRSLESTSIRSLIVVEISDNDQKQGLIRREGRPRKATRLSGIRTLANRRVPLMVLFSDIHFRRTTQNCFLKRLWRLPHWKSKDKSRLNLSFISSVHTSEK